MQLSGASGEWLWAVSAGTNSPQTAAIAHGKAITALPSGDLAICGQLIPRGAPVRFGALDVDCIGNTTSSTTYKPFAGRLSGDTGEWAWVACPGGEGSGSTNGLGIAADTRSGEIAITGAFGTTLSFGGTTLTHTSSSTTSAFVATLNGTSGGWTWAGASNATTSMTAPKAIAADARLGGYVAGGIFRYGDVSFGDHLVHGSPNSNTQLFAFATRIRGPPVTPLVSAGGSAGGAPSPPEPPAAEAPPLEASSSAPPSGVASPARVTVEPGGRIRVATGGTLTIGGDAAAH